MKAEELRKSILQMAIQGKLVPQDPNDEPASVLLERIRAEKQKLIKEGKIKKDKTDSIIFKGDDNCHYEKIGNEIRNIEDEIPFEIPDTWEWVRFPNIANFELGKTPDRHTDKYWSNGLCPWFSIADMHDKQVVTNCKEKISAIALKEKFSNACSPAGTLIMSFKLTVGRTSILGIDAVHNEAIISIFPYVNTNNITRNYLMNTLGLLVNYVEQTDAIKGATLSSNKLKSMFVPLPPLAEQTRIVAEIERFEPLIAEYERLEQQATKLDGEIYDNLKKSILQYAIQGKLVPQDPNDEPASVLLEKNRAEKKAKLGTKYVESYIYKGDDNCYYEHIDGKDIDITDEISYDLPAGWQFERLGNIIDISSGKNITSAEMSKTEQTYPVYGGNGVTGYYDKYNVEKNTIIIGRVGFYCGSVHTTRTKSWITDNALIVNYNTSFVLLRFMEYLLQWSDFGKKSSSTAQPLVTGRIIKPSIIGIPPLAEQQRIVGKINEIFAKL